MKLIYFAWVREKWEFQKKKLKTRLETIANVRN